MSMVLLALGVWLLSSCVLATLLAAWFRGEHRGGREGRQESGTTVPAPRVSAEQVVGVR